MSKRVYPPIPMGTRFGKLVVIGGRRPDHKYKCLCDCGKAFYVRVDKLSSGDCKSCGCIFYTRSHRDSQFDAAIRLMEDANSQSN